MGAAMGGSGGCTAGAIGALVGETAAELFNGDASKAREFTLELSQITSVAAAALLGQDANTALMTATNAVNNNYLSHTDRHKLKEAERNCLATGDKGSCDTAIVLRLKDERANAYLQSAVANCEGEACSQLMNYIRSEQTALGCPASVVTACQDAPMLDEAWKVVSAKAQGLEPVYPETWILDGKLLWDAGKGIAGAVTSRPVRSTPDALMGNRGHISGGISGDPNGGVKSALGGVSGRGLQEGLGRKIYLVDDFYQVEGSSFKFSKYYYERLWSTGRGAPFLQAEEVLKTARTVMPDRMKSGFFRYVNDKLEMVYNPITKEVWHIQPVRK